jgi:hypothetical protein
MQDYNTFVKKLKWNYGEYNYFFSAFRIGQNYYY